MRQVISPSELAHIVDQKAYALPDAIDSRNRVITILLHLKGPKSLPLTQSVDAISMFALSPGLRNNFRETL